ncbi:ParB/RepB/Spo0J family partition protein [Oscillibacter valericigenes]|nr:ParB/RepB/Spo0J family partition protein [Oscillibacter valericigenes]
MQKKGANISLKGYDDIFSTDQSRAEAQQERVQEIPLSELHPFEGHPFRVVDDEEMMKTAESVRDFGVLTPAIVRPDPDGGYEIVSGHRRHRASELAGKETMPAIVRDLDDDAAIILMVDANLQRESILPSERAYGKDAKSLLKELQSQNERMFMVTFLVLNTGRTEQELENNVFQAQSIAQKHNCNLRRLDFQQESGLMSSLPLAQNLIEIRRGLTTSSTAIFVPFTTQELFQNGGETLYYGLNALSNNLIMVDRKKLKNPNGLILGTPGSGKSFSAKREITNAFLVTDDDIIICDPEAEYAALVHKFNGQVVKISSSSTNYINPMDINLNYSEDDNPVALKADFILSLCELIMGSKDGLQPIEKTVIDRCVHQIYQRYFDNPAPENMPILEDLYDALLKQDEKEAHHVATALEIYVKGSLKLFNNRTNVDIQNRLVCFDIKELGNQLKKIGMLIVQDQVWGRVTANRSAGKSTRYYIDEFHLLLKEEQTATYSVEIWKRFRKWGGLPTGITQNVKDLLRSPEIANILENSDFIYMLNQASDDRSILAQRLNISPHQLSYVTNSGEGEGLLFYGNVILPFIDRFPTDLELYRIMTTKLNEVAQEKEA